MVECKTKRQHNKPGSEFTGQILTGELSGLLRQAELMRQGVYTIFK